MSDKEGAAFLIKKMWVRAVLTLYVIYNLDSSESVLTSKFNYRISIFVFFIEIPE